MDWIIDNMGLVIVAVFIFVFAVGSCGVYKEGTIRSEIIYNRSGKIVGWQDAIFYPEAYFVNGEVLILDSNK